MPADLLTLGNYRGRIVAHGSSTGHTFGLCSTLVPLLLKVCLSRAASVIVPQNVRKKGRDRDCIRAQICFAITKQAKIPEQTNSKTRFSDMSKVFLPLGGHESSGGRPR